MEITKLNIDFMLKVISKLKIMTPHTDYNNNYNLIFPIYKFGEVYIYFIPWINYVAINVACIKA